ncbi:MAG TPA: AraC family transcriptional regulator [Burkholderiaceae bacterium]|nr:AraC family transcriptional regulator [Burkholderiaceae bacterium]
MIQSSPCAEAQTSYMQLRKGIDLERLKRLEQEDPADPTRAVEPLVLTHSKDLGWTDLLVWEQVAQTQEFYLPPNNCYDVYIRQAVSSPVVQWRDGVLDVRHHATGEVVVAPPYRAMYFRTFGPGQNLHLSLTPELLMRAAGADRPSATVRLRNSFGDRDPVIAGMGRILLDYVKSPGERSRDFLESASIALAVRLLECYAEQSAPTNGKLNSAQQARIDEYLHGHLDGRVSLKGMAQLLGMSPYALHRAFKATYCLPPLRYSLQLRMRRARALVEGTRKPIGEIAAEVGFGELAHFTNTFRKHWGVAPSRLRER